MQRIKICEGGRVSTLLAAWQRAEIEAVSQQWRAVNNLREAPLYFTGAHGKTLHAAFGWAGVVEAGDVVIEIFPKLDAALLDKSQPDVLQGETVLENLLWMLEVSEGCDVSEAGTAPLEGAPSTFLDVWALLLARALARELEIGVPHFYQAREDDLHAVRGRILIGQQVTRGWNRMDKVACAWDEWTPDTPQNRLFKCCCRFLIGRVQNLAARGAMENCLALLDETEDVDAATALRETEWIRWNRTNERFKIAFGLARRLLQSAAPDLRAGEASTFVFLTDMAKLFEDYVAAVLEARFETAIETQKRLGYLFQNPQRVGQDADYFWRKSKKIFIGDAKYKRLHDKNASVEDVRQLTVYAELAKEKFPSLSAINLLLLYPRVGEKDGQRALEAPRTTWNNMTFQKVAVEVRRQNSVADCLPNVA